MKKLKVLNQKPQPADDTKTPLSHTEAEEARQLARLRSPVLYEVIRREGDKELLRPSRSLVLSGVAAGLCIGFSVIFEALFRTYLPDAAWRPLVENFGYTIGFLIVIMGRLQLFTENTITVILPACAEPTASKMQSVARLWFMVFLANMVGTALFALAFAFFPLGSDEVNASLLALSEHIMHFGWWEIVARGAVAGFLIAALVWILPSAEGSEIPVILLITYIIALGDFAHVIAGSVEAWYLVFTGTYSFFEPFAGYVLPALIGNIIGGTLLFTALAYGQVSQELDTSAN